MSLADKLFQSKNEKLAANLKAGEEFLNEKKKQPGVIELEGGLLYEILEAGTGQKPNASQSVTCHYEGRLIDGVVFDSSFKRGQPATFPLNRVIKGWTQALQLMPEGSTWRLYIPPALGYGNQQAGASIGPGSTLIFDVQLISVES